MTAAQVQDSVKEDWAADRCHFSGNRTAAGDRAQV